MLVRTVVRALTALVLSGKYISLLYCIMHSLTFEWNGRHQLKKLDGEP
jgi:hypothetical protein